ncbi:TPA: fimbrial protein, partial [Salmonella enterica subsp. enterica serovar Typhimurium var. monophasic 4,[5],12:i:-]|nr:fimbrial protein [Salmonella enterica subsp. enterica serovar Typhimurium var. monophasic 4,[5],12:i:-]
MKNLWMLLALSLFSGHALADGTMGNGSGWCQPTSGTHNFFFPLDQTITDTDENQAGKIVKESWSVGGEYSARCDCDNKDYQGVNYFTATTGDLTQKGTYSEAGSNGQQMDFYVLVAGKLEIGTETYIVGNLKQYIPVPFSAISNQDPTAGGCTGADINKMSAGNKGNVRIYITHPLVGEITIPETTIMNLYLSKTPGSSGDNIPPSVPPMAHVTM